MRAGMVSEAAMWPWSSAGAHCGQVASAGYLAMELWSARWNASSWKAYLDAGETDAEVKRIRQCTHTGRPLGSEEFVRNLEEATKQDPSRHEKEVAPQRLRTIYVRLYFLLILNQWWRESWRTSRLSPAFPGFPVPGFPRLSPGFPRLSVPGFPSRSLKLQERT